MNEFKSLEELNLLDRFLFDEAAEDPVFLKTVLEIILEKDIDFISLPQSEKEQRFQLLTKQARLDVWSIDDCGTIYDTEVQKTNTGNLQRRSRFYHNIIGAKLLKPGEIDYNKLNDVYVIIIAPFDLFDMGLHRYTFKMRCEENPDILLEEGTTTIFLNTKGVCDDVSSELKEMLRFFENTTDEIAGDSKSERVDLLRRKVNEIRESEDMGVKYMLAWEEKIIDKQEARAEGIAEGKSQGIKITRESIARKMKTAGMATAQIIDMTGISEEELAAL